MLKIYKNSGFIFVLISVFLIIFSCRKTNKKEDNKIKSKVYKCNEVNKGLISCNTVDNDIFIIDSIGNTKNIFVKNYNSQIDCPPIIIDKSSILSQEIDTKSNYIIKYNIEENKQVWKSKTNDKIISHGFLNDSTIVMGFSSGTYRKFNTKTNSLEDIYIFSRSKNVYNSNEILKVINNDIYVLSPILGDNSIVKINVISKKIIWKKNINYAYINFIATAKYIFYLATNDFGKGELGIINLKTGKVVYNKKTFPNVLTNPLLVNEKNIYFGNSNGKIMIFSLDNFTEKEIYSSLKKESFLGLGSSKIYFLDNYIYFMDNFKIYNINIKTNQIKFVKNYDKLGFNFFVKNCRGKLEVY